MIGRRGSRLLASEGRSGVRQRYPRAIGMASGSIAIYTHIYSRRVADIRPAYCKARRFNRVSYGNGAAV